MNLPINGRVAIIDDQSKHALPLIQIFSRRQISCTYFSGELKYLPKDGQNFNDIRLLFLDINLIDDSEHEDKVLKARLVPVLDKVVSEKNYPYVIVYWSRHERHRNLIEDDIFKNDLKLKRPIGFLSATKTDFFNLDGSQIDGSEEKFDELFDKINALINVHPAYSYLLNWENHVHKSTDSTLQDIFCEYHKYKDWSNNANFIINSLSKAYLGKHYNNAKADVRIKSCFHSFNQVFIDSLESSISNSKVNNSIILNSDESLINKENIINNINENKYREYIDSRTEALFISPSFNYNDKKYVMILDYRYLKTTELKDERFLFRAKQNLLSEVQSKLARHINRQGILYLEDR